MGEVRIVVSIVWCYVGVWEICEKWVKKIFFAYTVILVSGDQWEVAMTPGPDLVTKNFLEKFSKFSLSLFTKFR